jgi:hypothetical protein
MPIRVTGTPTLHAVGSGPIVAPAKVNGHERVPFMPLRVLCESNHQPARDGSLAAEDDEFRRGMAALRRHSASSGGRPRDIGPVEPRTIPHRHPPHREVPHHSATPGPATTRRDQVSRHETAVQSREWPKEVRFTEQVTRRCSEDDPCTELRYGMVSRNGSNEWR